MDFGKSEGETKNDSSKKQGGKKKSESSFYHILKDVWRYLGDSQYYLWEGLKYVSAFSLPLLLKYKVYDRLLPLSHV